MASQSSSIATLRDLLDYNCRQFISAESALKNKLHEWITTAASLKLKTILQKYLDTVTFQLEQIEAFTEAVPAIVVDNPEPVIPAYIGFIDQKLHCCTDPGIKDACLLAGIQAINHYKISFYGTAASYANAMEMDREAGIFHLAEVSEKQIDDRLSQLADFEINKNAKTPIVLPGQ